MNQYRQRNEREGPPGGNNGRQAGQGILEYMIIIALVGLAVVVIVNLMQPVIGNVFSNFVDRARVAPPELVGFTRVPPTPTNTPVPGSTLTIVITGQGTVTKNPENPQPGDWVTLTAVPAPGWLFAGWGDDLSGTNNPAVILMDTDKTVSALFVEQTFTLTVDVIGNGSVTVTPNQASYNNGQMVTLQAVPNAGFVFIAWAGDLTGTATTQQLVMNSDKSVQAIFQVSCYPLTTAISPTGWGTVSVSPAPNCNETQYSHGTVVTLSATPAVGRLFSQWSGSLSATSNPVSLAITGPRSVTANFLLQQFTLTTSVAGNGTISVSPNTPTYGWGTTAQLTAVPAPGVLFTGWSGDLTGTANPATLTFDGNKTVTANFQNICYPLTTAVSPLNGGNVTMVPSSSPGCNPNHYHYNQEVTLTANPAAGYTFDNWSGGASGTNATTTITIQASTSVTANFQPLCYPLTLNVNPSGAGTISANPAPNCAGNTYAHNTVVNLTANANLGYAFANWSGAASGSSANTSLTITGPASVTGNFTPVTSVLLVVGNPSSLTPADIAIRDRLQTPLGLDVRVVDDNAVGSYNPAGASLIVVASSVNATTYGSAFNNTAIPLILMKRELAANLRLGNTPNSTTNRREIDMNSAQSGHPLAAGRTGRVAIYGSNSEIGNIQNVGAGGLRIAYAYGTTNRFTIVGYPAGAAMTSGTAPAKRVGFFLVRANLYTTDGWALFDAAVNWSVSN